MCAVSGKEFHRLAVLVSVLGCAGNGCNLCVAAPVLDCFLRIYSGGNNVRKKGLVQNVAHFLEAAHFT